MLVQDETPQALSENSSWTPPPEPPEGWNLRANAPVPDGFTALQWRAFRLRRIREKRQGALAKAKEVLQLKKQERELIQKKVDQGMPITEEERQKLDWTAAESSEQKKDRLLNQVAKLVIKPQTVEELRLVVERTAAKHGYNPIEELIKLSSSEHLEEKERIAIHKALLPFLAPQLPQQKVAAREDEDRGPRVRVTVTQFVFQQEQRAAPLHTERPVTALDAPKEETTNG